MIFIIYQKIVILTIINIKKVINSNRTFMDFTYYFGDLTITIDGGKVLRKLEKPYTFRL